MFSSRFVRHDDVPSASSRTDRQRRRPAVRRHRDLSTVAARHPLHQLSPHGRPHPLRYRDHRLAPALLLQGPVRARLRVDPVHQGQGAPRGGRLHRSRRPARPLPTHLAARPGQDRVRTRLARSSHELLAAQRRRVCRLPRGHRGVAAPGSDDLADPARRLGLITDLRAPAHPVPVRLHPLRQPSAAGVLLHRLHRRPADDRDGPGHVSGSRRALPLVRQDVRWTPGRPLPAPDRHVHLPGLRRRPRGPGVHRARAPQPHPHRLRLLRPQPCGSGLRHRDRDDHRRRGTVDRHVLLDADGHAPQPADPVGRHAGDPPRHGGPLQLPAGGQEAVDGEGHLQVPLGQHPYPLA